MILDFEGTDVFHCKMAQFCLVCGNHSVSHLFLLFFSIFTTNADFQTKALENYKIE